MLIGLFAGVALGLIGGVIWAVTAAAANGRLARNGSVGIRTRATRSSDAAWRAGHQAALPASRALGFAGGIIGLGMVVDGIISRDSQGSTVFWALFAIGYGAVLVGSVFVATVAQRAARTATE